MFIVDFFGGLGNQMFQYAFLKKLEIKYPQTKIISFIYDQYNSCHNGFELEKIFNIKLEQSTLKDWTYLSDFYPVGAKFYTVLNKLFAMRRVCFGPKSSCIMIDDQSCYYPEVFALNPLKSYCFHGVWQNTEYFNDIKDIITNAFSFKKELDKNNTDLLKRIKVSNSVSIHIRRGDYLNYDKSYLLDRDYYLKAIDLIKSRVKDSTYFVFSDDIQAAKEILKGIDNVVFINNNSGTSSYIDMQLMTNCKHNITANSTFSFWGAYLNNSPEKLVIAPKKTFNNNKVPLSCKEWTLI